MLRDECPQGVPRENHAREQKDNTICFHFLVLLKFCFHGNLCGTILSALALSKQHASGDL